jgi:NAD(P)-dependent dehydrogenase (short-subunit alcohol dehydrogenase family)
MAHNPPIADWRGKTVWLIGASSGIGLATARWFLARDWRVVAVDKDAAALASAQSELERESPGRVLAPVCDVSDPAQVQALIARVDGAWGRIDALVNNAGVAVFKHLVATTFEEWRHVMATNLDGAFLCSQACVPLMRRQGSGSIVMMSSQAAFDGGGVGTTYYAATKGAILAYNRGLAKELAPHQIRVNCVAPGLIDTRFHDIHTPPDMRAVVRSRIPLGREGTPADVASAVVYLASDMSAYLTGETIIINGGQAMY